MQDLVNGEAPSGVLGDRSPQQGPGEETLVGNWGHSPQKAKTERFLQL